MHAEALEFVARWTRQLGPRLDVLELGSRNVNGSVRTLFGSAQRYVGIDCRTGPGVDIVADAATWRPPEGEPLFDLVVSTECLEHAADAAGICRTAWESLGAGGVFLLTAAGPKRAPHGADGGSVQPGEFYANVHPEHLRLWLAPFALAVLEEHERGDLYAVAVKGASPRM